MGNSKDNGLLAWLHRFSPLESNYAGLPTLHCSHRLRSGLVCTIFAFLEMAFYWADIIWLYKNTCSDCILYFTIAPAPRSGYFPTSAYALGRRGTRRPPCSLPMPVLQNGRHGAVLTRWHRVTWSRHLTGVPLNPHRSPLRGYSSSPFWLARQLRSTGLSNSVRVPRLQYPSELNLNPSMWASLSQILSAELRLMSEW